MTKGKFPNGLQAAMLAAEIGPTALGRLIGETKQDVARWADQSRRLMPDIAAKIAPHVSKTAQELLLLPDSGAPHPETRAEKIEAAKKALRELEDEESQNEVRAYAEGLAAAARKK